jgi:hypothetical protein
MPFLLIILIQYTIIVSVSSSSSSSTDTQVPSKQLDLHHVVYKPPEFFMVTELGRKSVLISFNYTKIDLYDRYIFRVRYHGHDEYATHLKTLDRINENSLKIKEMLEASYIVCVSLFSSIRSNKYPPVSTTGMCVDFTIGDSHPIGGPHNSTGLLAPLLFAVAAILLVFITVVNYFKRKKWVENLAKRAQRLLLMKRNRQKFDNFVAINMDGEANEKSEKEVTWSSMLNGESKESFSFSNPSFINDDNSETNLKDFYVHEGALKSIKSMSHLLDDKPWIIRSATAPRFLNKKF